MRTQEQGALTSADVSAIFGLRLQLEAMAHGTSFRARDCAACNKLGKLCAVKVEDIVVHPTPSYPSKVKARACVPLYECDRDGKRIKEAG